MSDTTRRQFLSGAAQLAGVSAAATIAAAPGVALGSVRENAGKSAITTPSNAIVETSVDDAFVADGELLATGRRFELSVLPRALRVIA